MQKAGDISSTMYSDAYRDAQANQLKALTIAPQSQQAITAPAMQLGALGTAEQQRSQQAIDEARARFEFAQQAPDEALSRYSNIAGSNILPGGSTTSAQGGEPSFGQKAIGAGLLGAGTYGALGASGAFATTSAAGPIAPLLTTPQGMAVAATVAALSLFD